MSKLEHAILVAFPGITAWPPEPIVLQEVQIRLYVERLEVYYKAAWLERMELHAVKGRPTSITASVIGSLVRAPSPLGSGSAFPTMDLRLAYDALKRWRQANGLTWRTLNGSAPCQRWTVASP